MSTKLVQKPGIDTILEKVNKRTGSYWTDP